MRSINDYSEYLATLKETSSKDPVVRDEAKKALEGLKQNDPGRYTLYRVLNREIEPPESLVPKKEKKEKKVYEKGQYIREHPELDIKEVRDSARKRLLRGPYGFYWRFDTPSWVSDEDMLRSLDKLSLPDMITINGNLVSRQTLIRRCVKLAVVEGRVDEVKLREFVLSQFTYYYNKEFIALKFPYLFEPVKRMLREEATLEELAFVGDSWSVNIDKLVRLINSKQIEVTDEEIENYKRKMEKQARHQARKKAKKEKWRAKKEAERHQALKDKTE